MQTHVAQSAARSASAPFTRDERTDLAMSNTQANNGTSAPTQGNGPVTTIPAGPQSDPANNASPVPGSANPAAEATKHIYRGKTVAASWLRTVPDAPELPTLDSLIAKQVGNLRTRRATDPLAFVLVVDGQNVKTEGRVRIPATGDNADRFILEIGKIDAVTDTRKLSIDQVKSIIKSHATLALEAETAAAKAAHEAARKAAQRRANALDQLVNWENSLNG